MCPICLAICNLLERPLHNPFFDTVSASCHTEDPIGKVSEGYCGKPNSGLLHMNGITDGIMREDTRSTELTEFRRGERLVDQVMFFKGVLAE